MAYDPDFDEEFDASAFEIIVAMVFFACCVCGVFFNYFCKF